MKSWHLGPLMANRIRKWLRLFGPGLITGAADDDPSGVATYSQAGAQFGPGMLWTMLLTFPLMVAIQEVSARVGRVTGHGLAGNLRRVYPPWLLYVLVGLLVVANTINIGADIGAMGAAAKLLVGWGPSVAYAVLFAVISSVLEIFLPYRRYAKVLMWLALSLVAYVATAFVVKVPWQAFLKATVVPRLETNADYLLMVVAVFGTTISPYLFFWQASQEAEEVKTDPHARPLVRAPSQAGRQFHRLRVDTVLGMGASNLIGWFIMVTAAATLNSAGKTSINSAATAAAALKPLAGNLASLVFAAGIIGTGLLAVPVLAGSASYALGETMRFPVGIDRKPKSARAFYGVIVIATLFGAGIDFLPINPIKALVFTAVVNGVVAVPIMGMTMLMSMNPKVMGKFVLPRGLLVLGWSATVAMALAALGMFATLGR
jgi:NRAMP (natural resistance-associated macrophage protein)-like metal ion transporter